MAAPLLEMRGIGKSFPGVRALSGVSFSVVAGEVHALVGENGAGKSTLMKILAGAQRADEGEIFIDGKPVIIDGPKAAERNGIGMVYQEFNLVPALNATRNIVLGREPVNGLFLDERAAKRAADAVLSDLGIELPGGIPASRMSVAQQQLVEIAKALIRHARLIVMDEPTAALTDRETDRLFDLIKRLTQNQVAIVYISHRLEELPRIADRITVLRDGQTIETRPIADMPQDEMIHLMVGRTLAAQYPVVPAVAPDAPVVLEVEHLVRGTVVNDVSFSVRAGEIVALAGLVGAGRTEIVRAIAAADRPDRGTVAVDGKPLTLKNPRQAIDAGLALITEDRKAQGLVLGMSVRENTTLAHLADFSPRGFISAAREYGATDRLIAELRIRTPNADQIVRNLSGGNQQKVVLAKWLVASARVLLFDEPTRGIDVGAKSEIYSLMVELAAKGVAIVMVSSELPEVIGMAHRVLVIRGGRVATELPRGAITPDKIIAAAAGCCLTVSGRSFALRAGLVLAGLAVVVAIVNSLTHGNFLTAGNILNVLRQITYNAILAVGQTFVIITAGIDLSVGSLVQLSGVLLAIFANAVPLGGLPLVIATVCVAIVIGALAGFVNALPVVRLGLPPFITTLAMMLIARGLAYKVAHGRPIPLAPGPTASFSSIGTGFAFGTIPIVVLWMLVIVAVFGILLTRTRFGRYTYALGGNEEAARLAGIDTGTIKTGAYMISGACAAIGGLLLMARFSSGSPQTGFGFELQSIAAVVVGGTSLAGGRGSIWGTFIGALLIGVLNNVMNLLDIESYTQEIVLGSVILMAVVLDELRKRYLRR